MTFERFYSIIRPHQAASFNTVKRAKIAIVCIVIFSLVYNLPHGFLTMDFGRQCVAYVDALDTIAGQFHYWLSVVLQFVIPFVFYL